jgi:hypothetical protein
MNDGGPAFPFQTERKYNDGVSVDTIEYSNPGMSLRDYFAAAALSQLAGNPGVWSFDPDDVAHYAYEIADAMIKEREK